MESIKNWMRDAANILFDDSKNDLRALPKTVRLQILLVLSFIWTTVFSLYVLGSARKSFLLSSNKIFAASLIQFLIDSIY